MKNLFRKAKNKPSKPIQERFCSKGHEVSFGRAVKLSFGDIESNWICPQCLVDFINANISEVKEVNDN